MKLDYKKTFLIGLGFFTISVIWSVYNITVPVYLDDLNLSKLLIGFIMAIDNMFAAIFNPFFGNLSDKSNNPRGKRMIFIMIGIPLSAAFFMLIPFTRFQVWTLIPVVILMNFSMCIYRAPAVSLMPDMTPPALRSQANGIINLMGGLGIALAMLAGQFLFNLGEAYTFIVCGMIVLVALLVKRWTIREPIDTYAADEKEQDQGGKLTAGQRKSLILILVAVFCWFAGYNGIETYLSLFGKNVLHISKSISSSLFLVVSVVFLLMAIPAGYVGNKLGRRRTILLGLVMMVIACGLIIFVREMILLYGVISIAGIGWALININSYPMVVQLAGHRVGVFTGYYYAFSMVASSVAPVILGALMDAINRLDVITIIPEETIFPMAIIYFILAGIAMLFVRHGEVEHATTSA